MRPEPSRGLRATLERVTALFRGAALALGLTGCALSPSSSATLEDALAGRVQQEALELAYAVRGAGKPVVLIHGLGASQYTWRHLVEPLARDRQVVAVDLKGFGASPKPGDGRYSLYDQALLVTRLIERLDLSEVTLVGHSMGGGVALISALMLEGQPDRLDRLVLIGTVAYEQRTPVFVRVLGTPVLGPLALRLLPARQQVRMLLRKSFHDPSRIDEQAVSTYAAALRAPGGRHAVAATIRQIIPADIEELTRRYHTLHVPTLILWGREDAITPLSVGERLHRALPASTLAVIGDAGHMPQEERPQATLAWIERFLGTAQ